MIDYLNNRSGFRQKKNIGNRSDFGATADWPPSSKSDEFFSVFFLALCANAVTGMRVWHGNRYASPEPGLSPDADPESQNAQVHVSSGGDCSASSISFHMSMY